MNAVLATVNTSGGAGTNGSNAGGNGFLQIGSNTAGNVGPSLTGGTLVTTTGPTMTNPFVKGQPMTPFIPLLQGGASGYGILSGINATSALFDALRALAPTNAVGAILRTHLGPADYGFDFTGYDALLMINLTANMLSNPMFGDDPTGMDASFTQSLLEWTTAEQWSSPFPFTIGVLGGYSIYETLIPTGTNLINAYADGTNIVSTSLADGGVAFLVPEPASLAVLGAAMAGLGALRRQRKA